MGDQGTQDNVKPNKVQPAGDQMFKTGKVLNGLNDQETDFPKNGRGPEWKMLRDSKISKGSI